MQARWGWIALGCVLALGCSGGREPASVFGGSTTGLIGGFSPAVADPGADSVALGLGGASANLVTLQIRVEGVSDIYGASFDLSFDPQQVEFVGWSPGDLLESGGVTVLYNVSPLVGQLVLGMSRSGPVAGVDVSDPRTLVQVTFRVTEAGASGIVFQGGSLLDSQPPGPSPIPGIDWFGGQFQAN